MTDTSKATKKATTKATTKALTKEKKPPKLNLKKLSLLREPLKSAGETREACRMCGLCKRSSRGVYAMPEVPGDWSGRLLIVRTGSEDSAARKLLRRLWRKSGYADSDVSFVDAVRCGSRHDPSMAQLRACRPFLLQAIVKLKPKNILALGSTALRALRNDGETSLTKNRGKEIRIPGL